MAGLYPLSATSERLTASTLAAAMELIAFSALFSWVRNSVASRSITLHTGTMVGL